MKRIIFICILICFSSNLAACTKEAVYTLKENEFDVEVANKDFDPTEYILKDDKPLSEEEKKAVKTGAKYDINKLGDYTLTFPEYKLELLIHVKDTQKPTLSIIGFSIKQGNVFTWNEETLGKLKAQAKDNYDSGDLLKKSLHCDSLDTTKVGRQTITCQIEDSSGNKGSANVDIEITAGEVREETPSSDIPEQIEKPKPIVGFD